VRGQRRPLVGRRPRGSRAPHDDPEVVQFINADSGEVYLAEGLYPWQRQGSNLRWQALGFAGTPSALTGAAGQDGVTSFDGQLVVARPDEGVLTIVSRDSGGSFTNLPPRMVVNYTGTTAAALAGPVATKDSYVLNRERRRGLGRVASAPAVPAVGRQTARGGGYGPLRDAYGGVAGAAAVRPTAKPAAWDAYGVHGGGGTTATLCAGPHPSPSASPSAPSTGAGGAMSGGDDDDNQDDGYAAGPTADGIENDGEVGPTPDVDDEAEASADEAEASADGGGGEEDDEFLWSLIRIEDWSDFLRRTF